MCDNINHIGTDWILERAEALPVEMVQTSPVEFNEKHRYLPASVSRFPGYIDYSAFPYWPEIVDSMDVRSPVREGYVMKGVQVAFTTGVESVVLYAGAHVRTVPVMYVTADKELAASRIEHNFIPMFQQSGFGDIFQSADEGNSRKTGKTRKHLQWIGGGYMIPQGAKNADKMRQVSIMFLLLDEVDAWADLANDGDPIQLLKDRTSAFDQIRKILIGSSPLLSGSSRIHKLYQRGDQRVYKLRCLKCGFPQALRWSGENKETGKKYGFAWDFTEDGPLDLESCRYHCQNCHHAHFEHDKPRLIHADNAFWEPTAVPVEPNIRSWHIPAMLSPYGVQPWSKCVSRWLDAVDKVTGKTKSVSALQVFYNNILGEPFEVFGGRVRFSAVSAHRRRWYRKGEIPNTKVAEYCDSEVLFLTCTVDVHHDDLFVAIWGWTAGMTCWLIDYQRITDDSEGGCELIESPAWSALQKIIDEGEWTADDGKTYRLAMTFIDANWGESTSTVVDFCAQYESGVYPIMGRRRTAAASTFKEFSEFTTQSGTTGYLLLVDHYKDRLAPVLRRTWRPDDGKQEQYTFNAPLDTTDDELRELTKEYRREKKQPNGTVTYEWHRPHGAANELWDLMVYGHASVEILAWMVCVKHFELDSVDWRQFWDYCRGGVFFEAD
jgi:phage terminase large subunit GpA-like protein